MANIINLVTLDFPTFSGAIVTVPNSALRIREPIVQPTGIATPRGTAATF